MAALARTLAALQRATQPDVVAPAEPALAGPADPGQAGPPLPAERDEDSEPTSPLPVILPGATELPRPAPVEAPRGFFEAARPASDIPGGRPGSGTGVVVPPLAAPTLASELPAPDKPARRERVMPEAASAKLEQLKDLYLTAEAIGEDALDKHFEQVSERQRQLIREFFERSGPGAEIGSDSAGG
jgi:hypothetical protein